MDSQIPQVDLLMDLESRHEDLLARLEELNKRVEKTLAECQVYRIRPPDPARNAEAA
jgi:hypothetical protein